MAHTVRAFTIASLLAVPFLSCRREDTRAATDVSAVTFEDAGGQQHSLLEYRGKPVLVDVWATWCPPCRKSLPEIAALQKAGGQEYVVLAISVDKGGWKDVKPFLEAHPEMGLQAVIPASPKALEPLGSIHAIPTTLVVGRDGRIRDRWVGHQPGRAEQALKAALAQS